MAKRSTAQQNTRAKVASESRRAEIVSLYLSGEKIDVIAERMGVHRRTVIRDINRARKIWKDDATRKYDELLPEKLTQLDEIRREAWEGWKESRKDATEVIISEEHGKTVKTKGQSGNPAFLNQLAQVLRLECQLRGILDTDVDSTNVPAILEVVIKTKAEHEELKTLNFEQYKDRLEKTA